MVCRLPLVPLDCRNAELVRGVERTVEVKPDRSLVT